MRSSVSRTRGHLIVYATFVVITYVFKAAESEEKFCVGQQMGIYCDHSLFGDLKKDSLTEIILEHTGTGSKAVCTATDLSKTEASHWMVECDLANWKNNTFKAAIYILEAEHVYNGTYTCKLRQKAKTKLEERNIATVTIIDTCVGHYFYLPGFTRGPGIVSQFVIPEPNNPWPELNLVWKIMVEAYGILAAGLVGLAFIIKCMPACLCKFIMGQYAKSSDGGSSSSNSEVTVPVEVYGGGSKVLAIVDDTYMQADYQTPTGSFMIIPDTLKINPKPFELD